MPEPVGVADFAVEGVEGVEGVASGGAGAAVEAGAVTETVEVVDGAAAVAAHFEKALSAAEHEVVTFGMPPFPAGGSGGPVPEILLLARRVTCRAVHVTAQLEQLERGERIRALASLGGQVRVVPALPVAMAVVDRREALVLSAEGTPGAGLAVVRHLGLCDALAALFEAVWARATPLSAGDRDPAAGLDAAEHAILQLLNAGMTDDVIGRQLGVSERTVRRKVAELAARLGAGSRFQIGAQAVRRGWV
jgi:DNA-binding NarL/FixJ family response regulator